MSYSARKGPLTLCSVLVGSKMAKKGRIQGCRLFALLWICHRLSSNITSGTSIFVAPFLSSVSLKESAFCTQWQRQTADWVLEMRCLQWLAMQRCASWLWLRCYLAHFFFFFAWLWLFGAPQEMSNSITALGPKPSHTSKRKQTRHRTLPLQIWPLTSLKVATPTAYHLWLSLPCRCLSAHNATWVPWLWGEEEVKYNKTH